MAAPQLGRFPHIVRNPAIIGGEPTVIGTRIAVRNIVVAARYAPTMNDLLAGYPSLTAELVEEACAFYEAHREGIDRDIEENDAAIYTLRGDDDSA